MSADIDELERCMRQKVEAQGEIYERPEWVEVISNSKTPQRTVLNFELVERYKYLVSTHLFASTLSDLNVNLYHPPFDNSTNAS